MSGFLVWDSGVTPPGFLEKLKAPPSYNSKRVYRNMPQLEQASKPTAQNLEAYYIKSCDAEDVECHLAQRCRSLW